MRLITSHYIKTFVKDFSIIIFYKYFFLIDRIFLHINLVCGKIDCAPSTRHTKLAKKIEDIEDEEEEGDDIIDTVDDDTEASHHDAGENQGGKKELRRTASDKSKTEINVR